MSGLQLRVSGSDDGQPIIIHPSEEQLLIVGYRVVMSMKNSSFVWPEMQKLHVRRVHWAPTGWVDGVARPTYDAAGGSQVMYLDRTSEARPDQHRDRYLFPAAYAEQVRTLN